MSKVPILLRPHRGGKVAPGSLVRVRPQVYAAKLSRVAYCTMLKAISSPCAMSPVVVEPVLGIFPPAKPFVVYETARAS
jgi:hypothetical protein